MGSGQPPLPCHPSQNVPACLRARVERGETYDLPRCQHGLLKLDPKADISAIQLVGPQTSREDFKSLYYEVYKLWRLPGSPPGEPEWIEELIVEVVSSQEDCLEQKGGKSPWMMEEPDLVDTWPPRNKTPRRGRGMSPGKGSSLM